MPPDLVLVVCTGNVCRSPYVEFTLRHALDAVLRIGSAGTDALVGEPVDPGCAELLAAKGVDTDDFAAR
ncbi:arsenate reductase/protein-tyrosine-phosphatase family protein [Flexivirga sp.]|uniref:arsenate reductase/protein-tyrosine-phosphatase family protein n=1 Tax=Flexivirga sp. TaxID=1962927 RepID=UPI003F802A62